MRAAALLAGIAVIGSLAVAPAAAAPERRADPCLRPVTGGPSAALLSTLGVLRRPATSQDRPPRWVRQRSRSVYPGAARFVALGPAGGVWIVPMKDVSDRFVPSEACIRTLPRSWRESARKRKRRDLRRRPVEGVEILPIDAEGVSEGAAGSPGAARIRASGLWHITGTDGDRAILVRGLVPDGVARVRVAIPAFRDERGRAQPAREVTAEVRENVFAARIPSPFDFETPEDPGFTWLDAAGATVGPT